MKEELLGKAGDDAPPQALKDFGAQWINYFSGVQQVIADNEQLRKRVAQLESENAALAETIEHWKKGDEWID